VRQSRYRLTEHYVVITSSDVLMLLLLLLVMMVMMVMLAQYECVYIERSRRRHILFRLFSAFLEVHRLVQTMQRHARQAIRLLNDA